MELASYLDLARSLVEEEGIAPDEAWKRIVPENERKREGNFSQSYLKLTKELATLVMQKVQTDGILLKTSPRLLTVQSAEYQHKAENGQFVTVAARASHKPPVGGAWEQDERLLSFDEQLARDYELKSAVPERYVSLYVRSHPNTQLAFPQKVGEDIPHPLAAISISTMGVHIEMDYPDAAPFIGNTYTLAPTVLRMQSLIDYTSSLE